MKRPDGSSISGEVGTDYVTVGGLNVADQLVELGKIVNAMSAEKIGADGCLGLSTQQTRNIMRNGVIDPQTSFLFKMAELKCLDQDAHLFTTAFYGLSEEEEAEQKSFCTFGYVDQEMVHGEISWAAVDSDKGMWKFSSASTGVNGDRISRTGNSAVADSCTPLILLSDEVCEAFYKQIEGATYSRSHQGWLIPGIAEAQRMPKLHVMVGEKEFSIAASEHKFSPTGDDGMFFGVVQSRGSNEFDVLGLPFLRSVYAIWDYGHMRFGCVARER